LIGNGDVLVGGAGSDVFQLGGTTSSPSFLATIRDFDGLPGGDGIDLEFVLPSGVAAANAANVLEGDTLNGSTFLSVNQDGDGTPLHFYTTAELVGVSTDLNGFLTNAGTFGATATPPVVGTAAGETLAGADTSTLVQGLGGNDALTGGHGFDTLDG